MIAVEQARQATCATRGYLQLIARADDAERADLISRALDALNKHEELCRAAVAAFKAAPAAAPSTRGGASPYTG
mgnify:CR=1 FL=1